MRNTNWLRYGLASVTILGAGLSAFVVACGDDDTGNASSSTSSSSGTSGSSTTSSGTSGSGTSTSSSGSSGNTDAGDSGTPPGPESAKIYFVHAGTDLGPDTTETGPFAGGVRVCFSSSTDNGATFVPTPFPALPTDASAALPGQPPGLFIGTGGVFPTSGAPLQDVAIRPYLMNAKSLADRGYEGTATNVPRCGNMLTAGALKDTDGGKAADLVLNTDYWQLPDIPKDTLKNGKAYILAVTGCTDNAAGQATNPGFCGNKNDGTAFAPSGNKGPGNLKVLVAELDTTTAIGTDELGASTINLSPQHNAAHTNLPAQVPAYNPAISESAYLDGGNGADQDGGVFKLTTPSTDGTRYNRDNPAPTATVKFKGVATADGYYSLSYANGPAVYGALGPSKLNNVNAADKTKTVQTASGNGSDAELYVNGKNFTFVLVGDPLLSSVPTAGPRALHYIGFANIQVAP